MTPGSWNTANKLQAVDDDDDDEDDDIIVKRDVQHKLITSMNSGGYEQSY
jgi:hypothetical protein